MSQPPKNNQRINGTIFGPTAVKEYNDLISRINRHIKSLTTVQFDHETGIRRHFFNGKLEFTTKVRGIDRDSNQQ